MIEIRLNQKSIYYTFVLFMILYVMSFFQKTDMGIPVNDTEIRICTKKILNFENQNIKYVSKFIYKCFQQRLNIVTDVVVLNT